MTDCLFCKIVAGEVPSQKVYEDENTYAFYDISPQARVHVLVVCKQHIKSVDQHGQLTDKQLASCLRTCAKVAEQLGIDQSGYRLVTNCGADGCQSVGHMHFHVLGGQPLSAQMA